MAGHLPPMMMIFTMPCCIFRDYLVRPCRHGLFQTVREKLGLAYAVQSFLQPYQDTGIFGIYAATDPSPIAKIKIMRYVKN